VPGEFVTDVVLVNRVRDEILYKYVRDNIQNSQISGKILDLNVFVEDIWVFISLTPSRF
jgi:hypothetical protein